jgi:hypothetical protein
MPFDPHRLADNLRGIPIEVPESGGESDGSQSDRRRGTATHTHRNAVAHDDFQRDNLALLIRQYRLVGLNQQVSVQSGADILIPAAGGDGKPGRGCGLDLQEELQGKSHGIEARAEVGRRGGKPQSNGLHA